MILARAAACLLLASAAAQAQTSRLSISSNGVPGNNDSHEPVLSDDSRYVAFFSNATNLVPGGTLGWFDVFVRDRLTGSTELVSVDSSGVHGNGNSEWHSISGDGRFVAFSSQASNLVAGDTSVYFDVFVRNRVLGTTELVSVSSSGAHGIGDSYKPAISVDGHFVAFESAATNFAVGDTNGNLDVFVRDRSLGTTEWLSVDSAGTGGNAASSRVAISRDGRYVTFKSAASNLVASDTNGKVDIFVRDRLLGTTERASVDASGAEGNGECDRSAISDDGRFVAFDSYSSNLVAGDTNQVWDVFVRDRVLSTTERVSISSSGVQANLQCLRPSISGDGRCVAFDSMAWNLVDWDSGSTGDIFVRDRVAGTTERDSIASEGTEGNGWSVYPAISSDGRYVVFESGASNLDPGDVVLAMDVFIHDRATPGPTPFCFGDGVLADCPCGNNSLPGYGCENSASLFGAQLSSTGCPFLTSDTLALTAVGELDQALSIFLQGDAQIAPTNFGDGLRCAGGALKRLFVRNASGGVVTAPIVGDPRISARSATLGDVIAAGTVRHYQVYYRDPAPGFCPSPSGATWNISPGVSVVWAQ